MLTTIPNLKISYFDMRVSTINAEPRSALLSVASFDSQSCAYLTRTALFLRRRAVPRLRA